MAGPWSEYRPFDVDDWKSSASQKSILYPEVFILKSFAFSGAY